MVKNLKTVFFGTPQFSIQSLLATQKNTSLVAVVTQPDRPRGRGQNLSPCEVKALALSNHIPVFSPESLRKPSSELSLLLDFLKLNSPDLFVVTAYGGILPKSFLDMPRLGAVNIHASLLPLLRGAAPIQRSLELGFQETGVSIQKMVEALDAGDVLAESKIKLTDDIQADELSLNLSQLSFDLLENFFKHFNFSKEIMGRPQEDHLSTYAKKITKSEGLWDPIWTARITHNKVRAFCIWPQVEAKIESHFKFKLCKTHLAEPPTHLESGTLEISDKKVWLHCADQALEILEIKPENKPKKPAFDYFQNISKDGHSKLRVVKSDI